MRRRLVLLLAALAVIFPCNLRGQVDEPPPVLPSRDVAVNLDSGFVENTAAQPGIVYSTFVEVPEARWLRVRFKEVVLAAAPEDGVKRNIQDSFLILLAYVQQGGPPPPAPGPLTCGPDPGNSPVFIGCGHYDTCGGK